MNARRNLIYSALLIIILGGGAAVWLRPSGTPPAAITNTSAASSISITVTDSGFTPAAVTIAKGTIVNWTSTGGSVHAIDPAKGSDGPHSPQLKSSETYSYTYNKPGTYRYIDVLQPTHVGTVTVAK